jgi:hypothetical protein
VLSYCCCNVATRCSNTCTCPTCLRCACGGAFFSAFNWSRSRCSGGRSGVLDPVASGAGAQLPARPSGAHTSIAIYRCEGTQTAAPGQQTQIKKKNRSDRRTAGLRVWLALGLGTTRTTAWYVASLAHKPKRFGHARR